MSRPGVRASGAAPIPFNRPHVVGRELDVSARLLRLPLYHDLSEGDVARVVETIETFFASGRAVAHP